MVYFTHLSFSSSTFRSKKGGQRLEDCFACPAGYSCPNSATVNPKVCGAGSYSVRPHLEHSLQCLVTCMNQRKPELVC